MAFGFLANLGSGLARLGSGFARGATTVGKGIGRGLDRLDPLGEDDPEATSFLTPQFNPEATRGVRALEDAVADAENDARADTLIERRDLPITSSSPLSLPPAREVKPIVGPPPVPAGVGMELPKIERDSDRRNLPIPQLPGRSGEPTPYSPAAAAKYDYVMKNARRDAEGNLIPMSEGGGFDRNWGQVLKNALLGASRGIGTTGDLGGAIGGALAAGAGTAIDPMKGYEFAFDVGERPKLEADMAKSRAERAAAMEEILNGAKLGGMQAETALKTAQADNTRADIDIARQAEERQRMLADSQRRLNEAKIQAELTGVPKSEDIYNPKTGIIERVQVYPNGKMQVIGPSGEAESQRRKDKAETERTKYKEGATTGRTNIEEAGRDRRQQRELDADREAAGSSGLRKPSGSNTEYKGTRAQAKADLMREGYSSEEAEAALNRLKIR
jgi:hypothetical protein